MEDQSAILKVPEKIKLAAKLVYASIIIGVISIIINEIFANEKLVNGPADLIIGIIIISVFGLLGFKIGQGKNWARIVFSIMAVGGTLGYPDVVIEESQTHWILGILSIIQMIVQFYVLILLFSRKANQWFKEKKLKINVQ